MRASEGAPLARRRRRFEAEWLALRGLAFSEDTTRTVRLDEGFDFLGSGVRAPGGKLRIKPSEAPVRRVRERRAPAARLPGVAHDTELTSANRVLFRAGGPCPGRRSARRP